MVAKKKQSADKGGSNRDTKKGAVLFLIVQGHDDKFYIAGNAKPLPDEYAEHVRGYRPTEGDGVFQSPRSFVVCVPGDDRLMKILGGVLPRK